MIVGCGDLRYRYLENLVTVLNVDLFYVPGNHDAEYNPGVAGGRAAGGTNLDLRTARSEGLLLAGFGGSIRYRAGAVNQYSQEEGFVRAARLLPRLWRNRLRYGRALDLLVTHSPPFGIHDDETHTHRGLKAINWLMEWGRPRYVLHGHMHYLQNDHAPDVRCEGGTTVMNVYPYRVIEIEDV
jgi:Icc-related predicted phosphoesterase